jgi:hypothetical protein
MRAIHTSRCRHLKLQSPLRDNSRTRPPIRHSHLACQTLAAMSIIQKVRTVSSLHQETVNQPPTAFKSLSPALQYQWAILRHFLFSTSYVTRSSVIWGHPRSLIKTGPRLCSSRRILKPHTTSPRTVQTASLPWKRSETISRDSW